MRLLPMMIGSVLALKMLCAVAIAAELPPPSGTPVLTISGAIGNTNEGDTAVFDITALESLGMEAIETTTPWHSGVVKFEGVPFDVLMRAVDARGTTITAVALNDYVTKIPIEDFSKFRVILAIRQNGQYMSVRDKGPLFIVYPYDSDPELQSQIYYGRSAWQLSELIVE